MVPGLLSLRHDEQEDEEYYDDRSNADDDVDKFVTPHLAFPHQQQGQHQHQQGQQQHQQQQEGQEGQQPPLSSFLPQLYGREKELNHIQEIYNHCSATSQSQIIFLPGYSGSGKSTLIHEFLRRQQQQQQQQHQQQQDTSAAVAATSTATSTNTPTNTPTNTTYFIPRVICGKYNELHRANPYSAIRDGFNEFGRSLVALGRGTSYSTSYSSGEDIGQQQHHHQRKRKQQQRAQQLAYTIHSTLGEDNFRLLKEIMPEFCAALQQLLRLQLHDTSTNTTSTSRSTSSGMIISTSMTSLKDLIPQENDNENENEEGGGTPSSTAAVAVAAARNNASFHVNFNLVEDDDTTNEQRVQQPKTTTTSTSTTTIKNSHKRHQLQQVFCQLIRALCGTPTTTTTTTTTKQKGNKHQNNNNNNDSDDNHDDEDILPPPLILFLDDLQWIDTASLQVLETILQDTTLKRFLFLGAYRSNEVEGKVPVEGGSKQQQQQQQPSSTEPTTMVDGDSAGSGNTNANDTPPGTHSQQHPLSQLISDLSYRRKVPSSLKDKTFTATAQDTESSSSSSNSSSSMEIFELEDLTLDVIGQFIADTLHLTVQDCSSLTQLVYHKTLGNIFFTMQGLEELVRTNGLYYDVMLFRWDWNIEKIQSEQLLSGNVVDMVQNKIRHLQPTLQQLLTLAAYTRTTISISILIAIWNTIEMIHHLVGVSTNPHENEKQKVKQEENEDTNNNNEQEEKMRLSTSSQQHEQQQEQQQQWDTRVASMDETSLRQWLNQAVSQGLLLENSTTTTTTTTNTPTPAGTMSMANTAITTTTTTTTSDDYTFAHDRIQEAARSFVTGHLRDSICFEIAMVLLRLVGEQEHHEDDGNGNDIKSLPREKLEENNDHLPQSKTKSRSTEEEWMIFTAVHYLNTVPFHYLVQYEQRQQQQRHDDNDNDEKGAIRRARLQLATWNLRAAQINMDKSAFPQAVELLRAAEACFLGENFPSQEKATRWKEHYDLCMTLFQHKLEVEFTLGNHQLAQQAVHEVLTHAKTLPEQCLAHFYDIELIVCQKDRDYALGANKAVDYLAQHGISLPEAYSTGEGRVLKEILKLKLVQGKRKLVHLLDGPVMDDYNQGIMKLLEQLSKCSIYSDFRLGAIVALTAQRLSFERGINQYLPSMLAHYATALRRQGKFEEAYKYGVASFEMMNRISEGASWVRGINAVVCVLPLKEPIDKSIEVLNQAHKVGLSCGDVEWACTSAMQYALCYFCAGWTTSALFEPRLILFEEEARRFGQPPSIIVTFGIFRQFVLNLHGKGNPNPVILEGKAIDEEKALAQFKGPTHMQTLRDISIFRLILAYVFHDDDVALAMVDRLIPCPEFDFPLSRQHLRDLFMGMASLSIGRKRNDKKYTKLGKQKLHQFQKLAKIGSANAPAMIECLRAEAKPSQERYSAAIEECSKAGFVHLEAIMTERCGLFLLGEETNNNSAEPNTSPPPSPSPLPSLGQSYLSRAVWLYHDWGAIGKVNEMRQTYKFLQMARRAGRNNSSVFLKIMSSHFSDETSSKD